jgi:hypothetical protein
VFCAIKSTLKRRICGLTTHPQFTVGRATAIRQSELCLPKSALTYELMSAYQGLWAASLKSYAR